MKRQIIDSLSPENWVYGYILYSLYSNNSSKFTYSENGTESIGEDSGYAIKLLSNQQGVSDPILFQITAESATSIHLQGGIPGKNYIDEKMEPNAVIDLLLNY